MGFILLEPTEHQGVAIDLNLLWDRLIEALADRLVDFDRILDGLGPVIFQTVHTLRAYLSSRAHRSWVLFPSQKDERMTLKAINVVGKRCARRADVQTFEYGWHGEPGDVSAHPLRHWVAWRMLLTEAENTLYDVRNRLRHATILMMKREYDHFQTI